MTGNSFRISHKTKKSNNKNFVNENIENTIMRKYYTNCAQIIAKVSIFSSTQESHNVFND
jgi:hypothetical protein